MVDYLIKTRKDLVHLAIKDDWTTPAERNVSVIFFCSDTYYLGKVLLLVMPALLLLVPAATPVEE